MSSKAGWTREKDEIVDLEKLKSALLHLFILPGWSAQGTIDSGGTVSSDVFDKTIGSADKIKSFPDPLEKTTKRILSSEACTRTLDFTSFEHPEHCSVLRTIQGRPDRACYTLPFMQQKEGNRLTILIDISVASKGTFDLAVNVELAIAPDTESPGGIQFVISPPSDDATFDPAASTREDSISNATTPGTDGDTKASGTLEPHGGNPSGAPSIVAASTPSSVAGTISNTGGLSTLGIEGDKKSTQERVSDSTTSTSTTNLAHSQRSSTSLSTSGPMTGNDQSSQTAGTSAIADYKSEGSGAAIR